MVKYIAVTKCLDCEKRSGGMCYHENLSEDFFHRDRMIHDLSTISPNCPLPDVVETTKGVIASLTEDRELILYDKQGKPVCFMSFEAEKLNLKGEVSEAADSFFTLLKDIFNPYFLKR